MSASIGTKLAFLIILFFTIVTFWSTIVSPSSTIPDDSDGLLTVWAMHRVQDNILKGKDIFSGNIFFPHEETIVFSDTFITAAVLTLPLRFVTNEPVLAYNVNLLLAQILTPLFIYLLCSLVLPDDVTRTKRFLVSLSVALVFAWSQIHLRYVGHLHMFSLQYLVGSVYFFLRWVKTTQIKFLMFGLLLLVMQTWMSIFLSYNELLFVAIFFICSGKLRSLVAVQWKSLIGAGALFGISVLPLLLGYVRFFLRYHAVRDIREVIHFSLIFPDFWGQFWSPVVYLCIGAGLLIGIRQAFFQKKSVLRLPFTFSFPYVFFVAGITFLVLSFGPALHWNTETVKLLVAGRWVHIPLPYTLFYYILPGFQAFRTPSRFLPFATICLLIWSATILRNSRASIFCPLCIVSIFATMIILSPMPSQTVPTTSQYPNYVSVLAQRPEQVVMFMPLFDWGTPRAKEDVYHMLYSTTFKKSMVNGQSGYFPDEWLEFQKQMNGFPSKETLQAIRNRGVQLLILQRQDYTSSVNSISDLLGSPVYEDNKVLMYRVL